MVDFKDLIEGRLSHLGLDDEAFPLLIEHLHHQASLPAAPLPLHQLVYPLEHSARSLLLKKVHCLLLIGRVVRLDSLGGGEEQAVHSFVALLGLVLVGMEGIQGLGHWAVHVSALEVGLAPPHLKSVHHLLPLVASLSVVEVLANYHEEELELSVELLELLYDVLFDLDFLLDEVGVILVELLRLTEGAPAYLHDGQQVPLILLDGQVLHCCELLPTDGLELLQVGLLQPLTQQAAREGQVAPIPHNVLDEGAFVGEGVELALVKEQAHWEESWDKDEVAVGAPEALSDHLGDPLDDHAELLLLPELRVLDLRGVNVLKALLLPPQLIKLDQLHVKRVETGLQNLSHFLQVAKGKVHP